MPNSGRWIGAWKWASGAAGTTAQARLYDGLTADDGDGNATTRDALRRAAQATEADYPDDRFDAHWVRDGDR